MKSLTAAHMMNPEVLAVRDDMTVHDLAVFLVDREISGAPVEDEAGRLVGVVSAFDVARAASGEAGIDSDQSDPAYFVRGWEDRFSEEEIRKFHVEGEGLRVRDVMTPAVYSVAEDASVSEVAAMMLDGHIHRVLVKRGEQAVGIITASTLLRLLVDGD